MPKVLYIVYWGALEPLGQSLVIPAVIELSSMGVDLTVVTFEKPHDLANSAEMSRVKVLFEENKIEWIPLKYKQGAKNTPPDIVKGVFQGLRERLKKRYDILHARTYVGGLIGLLLAPLIGAKFVYHNEGFYPDEQVDGGVWAENSRTHNVAKYLENNMYRRADGVIALSLRAKAIIENYFPNKPVIFVPSCVDLELFKLRKTAPDFPSEGIDFVYIGSVGNRYILDKVANFVAVAEKIVGKVHLQIYSKANENLVSEMVRQGGLREELWNQSAVPYNEMPQTLAKHQVGLFFLTQGISEHGCSPTKIGEYWAVGLPVVSTANVSDTDELIVQNRVGVIIKNHSEADYQKAVLELMELLKDEGLAERCHQTAVGHYQLKAACERQLDLYRKLTEKN